MTGYPIIEYEGKPYELQAYLSRHEQGGDIYILGPREVRENGEVWRDLLAIMRPVNAPNEACGTGASE